MRKLSPTRAISHALGSVWSFRPVAARLGMAWLPLLLLCGLAEVYFGPVDPMAEELTPASLVQLASAIVSVIAVCSIAVSWHRFILRDELGSALRLDGTVLRYAGNTVMIMLAVLFPALVFLFVVLAVPPAAGFALPAVALIGGAITRLSIKLPAVALGDRGFSFKNAWTASDGNFWPCLGVFLLSWAITLGGVFILVVVGSLLDQISPGFAEFFLTVSATLLQLFYAVFNASVFTSLYGFFVERRDF